MLKMNMKRMLVAVLCVMLAVSSTSVASAKTYKMKVHSTGNERNQSTPPLKRFAEAVEKGTDGGIKVTLHFNGVLGGDRQATEGMQLGTIECGITTTSTLGTFDPKFNVFDLPFLFKDYETGYKAMDGELGKLLEKAAIDQGLRIIAWGINGYRSISNSRKPINTPADLDGMKIRCMENQLHVSMFKALGANPTPMSFSELYTALSQKTVDGADTPPILTYSSKFYEVQKYYSLTQHVFTVVPLAVSERFFESLPENYQKVVLDAGKQYEKEVREATEKVENETIEELKKAGMQVNTISEENHKLFVEAAAPVYDEAEKLIGKDIVDMALSYLKN
jgi:C4-dicarboxylate-binding protein DctP